MIRHEVEDIRLDDGLDLRIEVAPGAIMRFTAMSFRGTDCHLIRGAKAAMVLGTSQEHEGVVIGEMMGSAVTNFRADDRAVSASTILYGACVGDTSHGHDWNVSDAPAQELTWAIEVFATSNVLAIRDVCSISAPKLPTGVPMNRNVMVRMGTADHHIYL